MEEGGEEEGEKEKEEKEKVVVAVAAVKEAEVLAKVVDHLASMGSRLLFL